MTSTNVQYIRSMNISEGRLTDCKHVPLELADWRELGTAFVKATMPVRLAISHLSPG